MGAQALLVELLISGFFAVACMRARDKSSFSSAITPRTLFSLTSRLERLKRSRWQWFSMVLLLVFVRMQVGKPIMAEVTALALFILFIVLPVAKAPSRAGSSGV